MCVFIYKLLISTVSLRQKSFFPTSSILKYSPRQTLKLLVVDEQLRARFKNLSKSHSEPAAAWRAKPAPGSPAGFAFKGQELAMKSAAMCQRWCVCVTPTWCCAASPACKGQLGKRHRFVPRGWRVQVCTGAMAEGGWLSQTAPWNGFCKKNASVRHAACLLHWF